MTLSMDGSSPRWISTGPEQQQSLSFKISTLDEGFRVTKQSGFYFQDQESSSSQSTGQSYPEAASVETKKFDKNALSIQSGVCGLHANPEEYPRKPTVSFQDYAFPHQAIDYWQSACFPHTAPYSHRLVTAYGPYPGVHGPIWGTMPNRVPLPSPQNEPVYVNAKQYKAILRRRESRAKLDAQTKLPKARKPYLHESRHRHALNRARGSGGRFLNAKKLQDVKACTESDGTETSGLPAECKPTGGIHQFKSGLP